jgi:aminoglycoside phosphotransferase (APT) family kinase protein
MAIKSHQSVHTSADRSGMFYWQVDRPFDEAETGEIFLKRHSHFRPDDVKRAITAGMTAYGLSPADAEVVKLGMPIDSGSVNIVVRAGLANGTDVVMRQHPDGIPNGYFWVEKTATNAARKVGVPTYETYYIDDSMDDFPFAYMLVSAVPGSIMNKVPHSPAEETALVGKTGAYAAAIHGIRTVRFGFFDNVAAHRESKLSGIHGEWHDHLFAAVDTNLAYLRDRNVLTPGDVRKIERIFTDKGNVAVCRAPVLVHNDIADWNELCDGNRITGIMDWDECFSGDPVMEFAAWRLFFPEERFRKFVAGYTEVSDLPEGYEEKMPLYMLRYVVAKAVTRRKKLGYQQNLNMQSMLDHAIATMHELFVRFGYAK